MSVQYRAVWQDDRSDLIDTGRAVFQEWLNRKNIELQVPSVGVVNNDLCEVRVDYVSEDNIEALRITLDETPDNKKTMQRWTTIVNWMTYGTKGWVWIDIEWVSDSISNQPLIFAPGLTTMLLNLRITSTDYPNLGPQPLRVESEADVDDLIKIIFDHNRSIPVIVFSVDQSLDTTKYTKRAENVARRLAGCADIRMLTKQTQDKFDKIMALIHMSVFDGAVRIYLPDIDAYDPQPWKHRYIRSRHLPDDPLKASDLIVKRILPRIVTHRPPEIYDTIVRRLLAGQNRDWQELALDQDRVISEHKDEIRRLRSELQDQKDEVWMAYETADEGEKEIDILKNIINKLESRLRQLNINPDIIKQEGESIDPPSSCMEAIERAQALEHIVIHPDAAQDIDRMDQNERSALWGKRIYRHLQSLDAYSEAKDSRFKGPFWEWCQHSGSRYAVPNKFIAMKESQSVRTNQSLIEKRFLPIDKAVCSAGRITMEAHLKPIEGGGMQLPRIYFHDDTMGNTGKVHVGFIGPHDLMPNKSAN